MGPLDQYTAKRDFSRTREPRGGRRASKAAAAGGSFVIHKHAARRLHYDLRLEHDGVLWSWAVTRGPSLDPDEKRLAVHVEDHPLDYGSFEGTIPKGEYGAGNVIIWDRGRWQPEGDPEAGLAKGHLAFTLEGEKLAGKWHLVRLKPRAGEKRDNWLLIKVDDEAARRDGDILDEKPNSVGSGVAVEDAGSLERTTHTRKAGTKAAKAKAKPVAGKRPAKKAELPSFVEPCLAKLVEKPPAGDGWLHEVKFDGYRVQVRLQDGKARLLTRSGLDWTQKFGATLAEALGALPCDSAVLDGEVVALGDGGAASFSALQNALSEGDVDALVYFAFDLLFLDGEDLRKEPLANRKAALAQLLSSAGDGPARYSEDFDRPGGTMLRHACRIGLEGIVSKRVDAPYRSGRGGDWLKSKCTQRQEFVITGYVPSEATGRGLRSILVGVHEGDALVPAGRVGTGFTARSSNKLRKELDARRTARSAYSGAAAREHGIVWVKPELVAEVEFRAWTASRQLRHASFLGLREDKDADEVIAEVPAPPPAKFARKTPGKKTPGKGTKALTEVKLSNAAKVLWPDVGLTKEGLLDYYAGVWPLMEPFVVNRPLSLVRAPDGIEGTRFFQKHAGPGLNPAVQRRKDPKDGEELLFIRDFDGLAALVQLGVLEVHIWGSTIDALETPDQVIFDLDPDEGVLLPALREAAEDVRDRLKELGFDSQLKTSGGKGFHVEMGLKPDAGWDVVKGFAGDFARAMAQAAPERYTATLSKKARQGRIFIDYLRNGRGATAIAPYSTRARPGAPVAMPVNWRELQKLEPNQFNTGNAAERGKLAEEWQDFLKPERPLRTKTRG